VQNNTHLKTSGMRPIDRFRCRREDDNKVHLRASVMCFVILNTFIQTTHSHPIPFWILSPESPRPFLFRLFQLNLILRPAHHLHFMVLIGRRCLLVFGRCSLRISFVTLVILVEISLVFTFPRGKCWATISIILRLVSSKNFHRSSAILPVDTTRRIYWQRSQITSNVARITN
jgi:hypothetical protein